MTDKQIIIDGVDVSGCCHQGKDNTCTCPHYNKECGRNPNCHYKIMQRQTKKLDEFYKRELEIKQKLFRKEQECEELNKEIHNLNSTIDFIKVTEHSAINKYNKLKQALTEIKEIAKHFTEKGLEPQ